MQLEEETRETHRAKKMMDDEMTQVKEAEGLWV
jgi:hypothetical protein